MSGVRDRRLPPFSWVSRAAVLIIQREFEGPQRNTALGLYATFAHLASEQHQGVERDSIEASRAEIAEKAGLSNRTVDSYAERFEAIGLLHVERRRVGNSNLPNLWSLIEPTQDVVVEDFATSETVSPGVAKPVRQGGETDHTPEEENDKKNNKKMRTTSSLVANEEARRLAALLAETVNSRGLPGKRVTATNDSVEAIDKLNRIDGVPWENIEGMIRWLDTSNHREALFWRTNVRSGKKLREHFAVIVERVKGQQAEQGRRKDGMTEDEHRAAVLAGAEAVDERMPIR